MSDSKQIANAPDEAQTIQALQASLYNGARPDSIRLVLAYCKAQRLDPFTKPVHIVPMSVKEGDRWVMRDTLMPGIGLYRIRADRTGQYTGLSEPTYGPTITRSFTAKNKDGTTRDFEVSFPEWCRVTVRKRIGNADTEWPATEYWLENYATVGRGSNAPNSMWEKRPFGQLFKCAESQALRRAFPDQVGAEPSFEERGYEVVEGTATEVVATHAPQADPVVPQPRTAQTRSDAVLAKARRAKQPDEPAIIDVDPVSTDHPEVNSPPSASQAFVGDVVDAEWFPDDDWPNWIWSVETLKAASDDAVAELAAYWNIEPPADVSVSPTAWYRAAMVSLYESRALPALLMWATDLAGKFADASSSEYLALIAESITVARALTALEQPHAITLLRNAADHAKRRLKVVA